MTAQEKAKELVEKMNDKIISFENIMITGYGYQLSKQCALMAVEEILKCMEGKNPDYLLSTYWHPIDHWKQVKEEIEKL
jgi:hypothetical protein